MDKIYQLIKTDSDEQIENKLNEYEQSEPTYKSFFRNIRYNYKYIKQHFETNKSLIWHTVDTTSIRMPTTDQDTGDKIMKNVLSEVVLREPFITTGDYGRSFSYMSIVKNSKKDGKWMDHVDFNFLHRNGNRASEKELTDIFKYGYQHWLVLELLSKYLFTGEKNIKFCLQNQGPQYIKHTILISRCSSKQFHFNDKTIRELNEFVSNVMIEEFYQEYPKLRYIGAMYNRLKVLMEIYVRKQKFNKGIELVNNLLGRIQEVIYLMMRNHLTKNWIKQYKNNRYHSNEIDGRNLVDILRIHYSYLIEISECIATNKMEFQEEKDIYEVICEIIKDNPNCEQ